MKNLPLIYFEAKPPKLKWSAQVHRLICPADLLDLVKDHARRLVDAEQSNRRSHNSQGSHQLVV